MSEIKAIETEYQGYKFRSRLEARWAVFFDTLGVQYQYEPEGYDLGGVWYLPDFYLPRLNCWFEVKGGPITDEASHKAYLLCRATKETVIMAGDMFTHQHRSEMWHWFYLDLPHFVGVRNDWGSQWAECTECGIIAPVMQYGDDPSKCARISEVKACPCGFDRGTEMFTLDSRRVAGAYLAAQQARFEHGETPQS